MISTALILVGGKGTRLAKFLPDIPKPLAPIAGKPLLERILSKLSQEGIKKVVLLTGYRAADFQRYQGRGHFGLDIHCSEETSPLGSAGAILQAKPFLNGEDAFLVINGDTAIESSLKHFPSDGPETMLANIGLCHVTDSARYGSVEIDDEKHVLAFHEKGTQGPSLVNAGIFLLQASILPEIEAARVRLNSDFISLEQDIFPKLVSEKKITSTLLTGRFYDIGLPESYAAYNSDIIISEARQVPGHGKALTTFLIARLEERPLLWISNQTEPSLFEQFLRQNYFFKKIDRWTHPNLRATSANTLIIFDGIPSPLDMEELSFNGHEIIAIGQLALQTGIDHLFSPALLNSVEFLQSLQERWLQLSISQGQFNPRYQIERPALILDRDGVVIEYVPYIQEPEHVTLREGIVEVIRKAIQRNWPVVVITNQSGLGRGYFEQGKYHAVDRRMRELLAAQGAFVDAVYLAPFYEGSTHTVGLRAPHERKSRTGLLLKASQELGLNISCSIFIGDSYSDIVFATLGGIKNIYMLESDVVQNEATKEQWSALLDKSAFLRINNLNQVKFN